jgi:transcriptional regulator with XRE-family HTH domain
VIAESLRRAREEAGLTREELAERVRVNVKAVAAYEGDGARIPRADVLERILDVLSPAAPWFPARVAEALRVRRPSEPLAAPRLGARTTGEAASTKRAAKSVAGARAAALRRSARLQKIKRVAPRINARARARRQEREV